MMSEKVGPGYILYWCGSSTCTNNNNNNNNNNLVTIKLAPQKQFEVRYFVCMTTSCGRECQKYYLAVKFRLDRMLRKDFS